MGKMKMTPDRTLKMVQFAVLVALTVVLQLLCSVMTIGPVTITLSLVPVVIAAALFGVSGGAILGFVLGLVNFIASFSNGVLLFLFQSSPVLYILTCFGKTVAAGAVAGLLYKVLRERHPYIGVTLAALSAPVVNTGIFFVMMALFFRDAIRESCGLEGGNVVAFIITGFIGAFKAYSDAVALFGTDLNASGMNTIVGYVYDMLYGNSGGYPSYASAAAIILFAVVLTITCINLLISTKHVHYS